jgi:hypothetical protein
MCKVISLLFLLWVSFFSYANDIIEFNFHNIPIRFSNAVVVNEYSTRIPFKLVDRLIVIEGSIKNKKGDFIIDTGSETMILNKVHFKIHPYLREKKTETSGILSMVDNPLEKTIKSLSIKDLTLENRNSDIIDLSHIEKSKKMKLLGIIGFNILKDYEVFIDLYLNQITLTKIDKSGNTLGKDVYLEKIVDSLDFKLKKHTIVIDGFIGKENVRFGLDSGAEFNQINRKINKKALKHFYPKQRVKLSGASGKKIEVLYGNLFRVNLSKTIYFGPMKTILTSLHNMNKAFGTNLDGVLGYDFFAQKRVIINYQKQKLYFIKYPLLR